MKLVSSRFVDPQVIETLMFAAFKHKDQRRKDKAGTPYINHPISLAQILIQCGITDSIVICGALLHDTIEDTETTYEELSWRFGPTIADIVEECSDDKSLDKLVRKQLQIDHAAGSPHYARLVKLADKIANLEDLLQELPVGWTVDRALEYFDWAKDVVDQMRGTNVALEDRFDLAYGARRKLEAL